MAIDFESHTCFAVAIERVDGHSVRAQESRDVCHSFNLNPELKRHEFPNFIIPKSGYAEIKAFFDFELLK